MHCCHCNRDLTRCICEDCDTRIAQLKTSPYLDTAMFEKIEAERLLAKFEIDEDRQNQANQHEIRTSSANQPEGSA